MFVLWVLAYIELLIFGHYLRRNAFATLYHRVRQCRVRRRTLLPYSTQQICRAVDVAGIWYPKPVLCLQRSAAAACLLRQCGIMANMIIGVQPVPFRAHAWVEVEGQVVNDRPYVRDMYMILDRC